jgi:hypothetical protein
LVDGYGIVWSRERISESIIGGGAEKRNRRYGETVVPESWFGKSWGKCVLLNVVISDVSEDVKRPKFGKLSAGPSRR